jgi:phenylacetate-CoA ligase
MSIVRKAYNYLPNRMKYLIDKLYYYIPDTLKGGKEYRNMLHELQVFENISIEDKNKYLVMKLREYLIYAYETTDFYKKSFDENGFDPYSFHDLRQMQDVPMIDKGTVIEHMDSMISVIYKNNKRRYLQRVTTGGTSGVQMVFYQDKRVADKREKAYFDYLFAKAGYNKKFVLAVIRNNVLPEKALWQFDVRNNKLIFDPFHLSDDNMARIIKKLNDEKVLYFHTYPSTMMRLGDYIKRTGDGLTYTPKAIFASSENLYEGQREFIEHVFGCKLYIHYGHSEKGCVAGWCTEKNHYHIEDNYGYFELLEDDKTINLPDVMGEIVCTSYHNKAMPLIRYRTGDYAMYEANDHAAECQAKNVRFLSKVVGRWTQEMFYDMNGTPISITAVNVHSDIFDHVKAYQYYQDTIGQCTLLIVKRDNYTIEDETAIYKEIQKRLGENLKLHISYVEEIEKTKSGKYKYIIQKLNEEMLKK